MKRHEILQSLFGSDDEEANSKHELNHQADSLSNEEDEGSGFEDGGSGFEDEGQKFKVEGGPEVNRRDVLKDVHQHHLASSRSPDNEKGKGLAVSSASVIHDVFGDSDDDELVDYAVQDNEKNASGSPKYKGNYAEESQDHFVQDEDAIYGIEEECMETNLKGKAVAPPVVFEIPSRPPPAHPHQMATVKLSNLIGIAPKPFDPATYVEEDIYVTDVSGSKRHVPHANIIRWREVRNPDGTTSVESNARFVTWSDRSLQLFIGNEAFDVSELDAKEIQSHLFLGHGKGIYQSQGRISRNMKFMPSSLYSSSHRHLTALVDSRHKRVNKVRQYITDVDPEGMVVQQEEEDRQASKATKQLNEKKKKVRDKYIPKGHKEHRLTTGFLEHAIDETDYEPPNAGMLHHFDLNLEKEAATEQRIMNAKKGPTGTHKLESSMLKVTQGPLNLSKDDKLEHGRKGNKVEGSMSHGEEKQEEEDETYGYSEVEAEVRRTISGSNPRKKYVKDEKTPARTTATRHQVAFMAYSDDE